MVAVSIIVKDVITHIENLVEVCKYAKDRGIKYEVVKSIEDAKGKYIWLYNTDHWYADYFLHWSYLRLSMPHGFEPGDIDLPDYLDYKVCIIHDSTSGNFGKNICKEEDCEFQARVKNGYGNRVKEEDRVGKCIFGQTDGGLKLSEDIEKKIKVFVDSFVKVN